jgi:hypothetical protein
VQAKVRSQSRALPPGGSAWRSKGVPLADPEQYRSAPEDQGGEHNDECTVYSKTYVCFHTRFLSSFLENQSASLRSIATSAKKLSNDRIDKEFVYMTEQS